MAAILLAAGSASRMGDLKQLLPFRGATLVEHAIQQAREAEFDPIVVVLGAQAEAVRGRIAAQPVAIVENPNWEKGMGSSIAAGARHLQELPTEIAAIAVLLADQPLITGNHLRAMRAAFLQASSRIVAARYAGTLGVPALFPRSMLPALRSLAPELGARSLLRDSERLVTPFDLPEGAADVDTPADFAALSEVNKP